MAFYFLMCSERSGSNLITKMMNAHRDVCGPFPKHIMNPVARNLFRYKNLKEEKNWNELLIDIEKLFNVDFAVWKAKLDFYKLITLAPRGDISTLIKNIYIEEAKENKKVHLFIKENQIYEFILFLTTYFPEAKYLYQVRDPRDMALSWKKSPVHKDGVIAGARQWKKDQVNFLKNYYILQQLGKAYLVKYEEIIADTNRKLEEICNFLGIPFDENMVKFYKDNLTNVNAKKQKAWNNLSKSIIKDNKDKYKNELTEEEILCIEKICYPEMIYLNYEPVNTFSDIELLKESHLEELEKKEQLNNNQEINEGIVKNMELKKVFYNKVL